MKTNLHTIEHELDGIVVGSSVRSSCNDAKLEYPVLFNAGDHRYYDNNLYVTTSQNLEDARERIKSYLSRNPSLTFSCACLGAPPAFCVEARNCDIVWTDESTSIVEVFNATQRAFQRLSAWERELDEIIECGGSLPDLVNASLAVFRNDLCITDPFSRVLAHRVYRSKRFAREQTDLIQEGAYLPKSMVLDGVEDERDGEDFTSLHPTFATMSAFRCTVLRSIVNVSDDYALILSVHPNYQPVGEKDCSLALVLAKAMKRLVSAFGAAKGDDPRSRAHDVLRELVQGKRVPEADAVQCAVTLGWSRNAEEYLCLCVDFAPAMNLRDCRVMRPSAALCNQLEEQFDCLAFDLNGSIVAVVNLTRSQERENELLAAIKAFAQSRRLVVGSSTPYLGLDSIPDSYRQARAALHAGFAEEEAGLVRFGERALDIGLGFIAKEMGPERFSPRPLVEMARQCQDLYRILEAYLKANCNSNAASKQLNLQRNSFVYRLEKAKQLLAMDLDDPDVRLLLLLSLKLVERYGLDNRA